MRRGVLKWWTPEDLAHFKAASTRLVNQYNAYQPFPDLHVNGQLTLAENIADVAGLSAARAPGLPCVRPLPSKPLPATPAQFQAHAYPKG
jgi:hypothetical protein